MGWASASYHFDVVADALIETGAPDAVKTAVCSALIKSLHAGDWDTDGESLGQYQGDPAIVQAFRENGVVVECHDEADINGLAYWCSNERGHLGDHQESWSNVTWKRSGDGDG